MNFGYSTDINPTCRLVKNNQCRLLNQRLRYYHLLLIPARKLNHFYVLANRSDIECLDPVATDFIGFATTYPTAPPPQLGKQTSRAEERRLGKECVSTCRSR